MGPLRGQYRSATVVLPLNHRWSTPGHRQQGAGDICHIATRGSSRGNVTNGSNACLTLPGGTKVCSPARTTCSWSWTRRRAAIGSGAPDWSTPFPSYNRVDDVRVFKPGRQALLPARRRTPGCSFKGEPSILPVGGCAEAEELVGGRSWRLPGGLLVGGEAGRGGILRRARTRLSRCAPPLPLARIFHTPMETPTLRRVRARGLQARITTPVGRVPSRGARGCEISGLGENLTDE